MTPSERVREKLLQLQNQICNELAGGLGGEAFTEDRWERAEGGGGISRIIENGAVFEKAGVNFSHVSGASLPPSASAGRPELAGRSFEAMGVSLVLHPHNPFVPTTHANIRFFQATAPDSAPVWWFGGGFDLTPYYPFREDVVQWHTLAKSVCDRFNPDYYPRFKAWCDRYFYLNHRGETRGVGGLFFDDLHEGGFDFCSDFTFAVGAAFTKAYLPILAKRRDLPFGERERQFQLYRRGRYVEFNLLFDRGTIFGLQSGGRVESILMSLPPLVRWDYDWRPEPGSPEAKLYEEYLKPQDWLGLGEPGS